MATNDEDLLIKLRKIDEKSYPYIRGLSSLQWLLELQSNSQTTTAQSNSSTANECCFFMIAGHIFVLFQQRILLSFDAVPDVSKFGLSLEQTNLLKKSITQFKQSNEQQPQQQPQQTSQSQQDALEHPLIVLHSIESQIVRFQVAKVRHLHLFVLTASCKLHIFDWRSTTHQWAMVDTLSLLPTAISTPFIPRDFTFSSTYHNLLLWGDSRTEFYSAALELKRTSEKSKKENWVVESLKRIEPQQKERSIYLPSREGLWFVGASTVQLWSFKNQVLYQWNSQTNNNNSNGNGNSTTSSTSSTTTTTAPTTTTNNEVPSSPISPPAHSNLKSNKSSNNSTNSTQHIHHHKITNFIGAFIHNITQELVVIDSLGRLFLCRAESGSAVSLNFLSLLESFQLPYNSLTNSTTPTTTSSTATTTTDGPWLSFFALNHFLIWVNESQTKLSAFDIRTGKLLQSVEIPTPTPTPTQNSLRRTFFSAADSGTETYLQLGFWTNSGEIFEVRNNMTVTEQIQQHLHHQQQQKSTNNANANNNSNDEYEKQIMSAVLASRDWNLMELETRNALEFLLSQSKKRSLEGPEVKVAIESLVNHLQSPALLLPLLSNSKSRTDLFRIVKQFLEQCSFITPPGSSEKPSSEADKLAAVSTFHYFTPLNQQLIPLLKNFVSLMAPLQNGTSSVEISPQAIAQSSFIPSLASLSDPQLIFQMSRARLEYYADVEPELLLTKLESLLLVRSSFDQPPHPALLHPEEKIVDSAPLGGRPSNHLLFETMCRLYYEVKPSKLFDFVRLVDSTVQIQKPIEVKSVNNNGGSSNYANGAKKYFLRAFLCLPPGIHSVREPATPQTQQSQQQQKVLTSMELERLRAKVGLLGASGAQHLCRAAELLLDEDQWEDALRLVGKFVNDPIEHSELFHVLLVDCLEKSKFDRLDDLWRFLPESFTTFQFLRILKQHLFPSNNDNDEDGMSGGSGFFSNNSNNNNNNNNNNNSSLKLSSTSGNNNSTNNQQQSNTTTTTQPTQPHLNSPLFIQTNEYPIALFKKHMVALQRNSNLSLTKTK